MERKPDTAYRFRNPLALSLLFLVLASHQIIAQPSGAQEEPFDLSRLGGQREQAMKVVQAINEARRAQAKPTSIYSPVYSFAGADKTQLLVLNNISDPVRFELAALNQHGEPLPLGKFEVGVTRHLEIPLGELLAASGENLRQGSLRISYLGDEDTLQAWAILKRGNQVAEVTFEGAGEEAWKELIFWWDDEMVRGTRPVVRLLNVGDRPLSYSAALSSQAGEKAEYRFRLAPGASRRLTVPGGSSGSLRFAHDGEPGALKAIGLLEGPGLLSSLPSAREEDWDRTATFEAIRVPYRPSVAGSAVISLFNAGLESREAQIEVFDPVTGLLLLRTRAKLTAGEGRSVDLGSEIATKLARRDASEVRVRVTGDAPGLAVAGRSRFAEGEVLDHTFFRGQNAHSSGSYPLLPLATHETFATLVNLGEESSEVVAQFYWEGGAYAYGPFLVRSGASYRLDVGKIAARQEPDLLGRRLDPGFRNGFFKWTARRGSNDLIARTESRPLGARDSFGFNCFGCCSETPWGEVLPGSVSFLVEQSPTFQACVNITTCNGTMGPYLASPTSYSVPAPFSWNGHNISATAAAQKDVWFYGEEQGVIGVNSCTYRNMPVSGLGRPSSCKTLLIKTHSPPNSWIPMQTCSNQVDNEPKNQRCSRCSACCSQIYAWKICTGVGMTLANSERQACINACNEDHLCSIGFP